MKVTSRDNIVCKLSRREYDPVSERSVYLFHQQSFERDSILTVIIRKFETRYLNLLP